MFYAGLMTGTSMDGIDAVLMDFTEDIPRLVATHSAAHDTAVRERLMAVSGASPLSEIMGLDAELGEVFAAVITTLLEKAGVATADVAAIGSHGQTLWHAPDAPAPSTLQIGDPHRIAQRTGITVVADFRRRDLAAGGQGAPLAPLFHQAFFHTTDEDRIVANIGGMANVTRLPSTPGADGIRGFDTGPGNVFLDSWYARHQGGTYDQDGTWAGAGEVSDELLARLLADAYFSRKPPKSTGRDYFNDDWLAAADLSGYDPETVQATLAQLTAETIAAGIRDSLPTASRALICGGGARNGDLMRRLQAALPGMFVDTTDAHGIPADWVEAAGFAWLAREALAGRPGNLPSVTGAGSRVPLGAIHPGSPEK
ncbi:anhydro-N-acetylmuramic acid kinase [Aquisalimonas sp.]|uniref:anhydro-N-acetylmuramic acid kinase n=1 Tax=unclassified Aquisalimonas TaxID=2644645 RepID=UPI0025BF018F|nr:anhydro-N-acetylmuramic acid kinase [Aquisalimonas sp.]